MIAGHFGLALGVRALDRRSWPAWRLPALLIAGIVPDLVDIGYAVVRFCSPFGLYSHSLPAIAVLVLVVVGTAFATTRDAPFCAALAAVIVVHPLADLVTGDKLLWPGVPSVGLVLYKRPVLDFIVELPIIVGGWALLRRNPQAPRWARAAVFVGSLILIQAAFDIIKLGGNAAKPNGCKAGTFLSRP